MLHKNIFCEFYVNKLMIVPRQCWLSTPQKPQTPMTHTGNQSKCKGSQGHGCLKAHDVCENMIHLMILCLCSKL